MVENRSHGGARFESSPVADGGTPVETWTGWDRDVAPVDLGDCGGMTIVAPHPDDETLGLGATIAMLCAAGVDVQVVSVSDGGAAYPGLSAADRAQLEMVRRAEIRRSMGLLGAGAPIRLEMPDGELCRHEQQLTDRIAALLADFPAGRWCAATWRGDGHPDHEAVGRASAAAAAQTGAVFLEYPVWMWHWAGPEDPSVPWNRARRVALTDNALNSKNAAVQCFTSQTRPGPDGRTVLPPAVVRRLLAVGEVVFV
ncbi:MAG: PIG-L family deacetylase [Mycobacterium sp.]|uniref:PIG-L deacetylase family protein n=1 Tax=Mycobacterium sp. TaxID=1785 RepID=UPI003BB53E8C